MQTDSGKINQLMHKMVDHSSIFGCVAAVAAGSGETAVFAAGNLHPNSVFAIASITKLFTAAVIYNLAENQQLSFEQTLGDFFAADQLQGLHILKGKNNAASVTIRQLLSHTSGFPDYSTEKPRGGRSYFDDVFEKDSAITFDQMLQKTRQLKPHFINGATDKAFYSDLNFDLLGAIAEKVSGETLAELYQIYIIDKLQLKKTCVCQKDSVFSAVYLGKKTVDLNLALTCSKASGCILSDAGELIIFLKAFFQGQLFPVRYLATEHWNRIQWFPLEYGMGMMRCKMSRWLSPFFPAPEILGHSGSVGSFAFYCPEKDLFVAGTINQFKKNPFKLIYSLLNTVH